MTNNENERAAYAAGDMVAADLYAELIALRHKCDSYEAALEAIAAGSMNARQAIAAAAEVLP
jgi:hypothetical protein